MSCEWTRLSNYITFAVLNKSALLPKPLAGHFGSFSFILISLYEFCPLELLFDGLEGDLGFFFHVVKVLFVSFKGLLAMCEVSYMMPASKR